MIPFFFACETVNQSLPLTGWHTDCGWASLIFEDATAGSPGRSMLKKFNGPRVGGGL